MWYRWQRQYFLWSVASLLACTLSKLRGTDALGEKTKSYSPATTGSRDSDCSASAGNGESVPPLR